MPDKIGMILLMRNKIQILTVRGGMTFKNKNLVVYPSFLYI